MPGPDFYNNWVKEKPVTTNQVYGFYLRDEMVQREKQRQAEKKLRTQSAHPSLRQSRHVNPRNMTLAEFNKASLNLRPKFNSSRPTTYFIAPPLPRDYNKNARPATAGQSLYLWNTLSGCTVKAQL